MNIEVKKELYEVIMFIWNEVKNTIFIDKPNFDRYVTETDQKYQEYKANGGAVFDLFREINIAVVKYLDRRGVK